MLKKILTILCFFTLFPTAYSQDETTGDSFITKSGKTVFGEITKKFDENQKAYFEFKSEEGKPYDRSEITSFETKNGDFYVNGLAKERFARQILTGELDLYIADDSFIVQDQNGSIYHLEEKTDTITSEGKVFVRKSNSWIGVLQNLTKTCESLNPDELKFNEKIITEYIKDYHDCIDKKYYTTNSAIKSIETQIGLSFGLSENALFIEQDGTIFRYYPGRQSNRTYFGGIDVYFSFPRKNINLSYSSGIQFHDHTFTSSFIIDRPINSVYLSQIEYNVLTIPFNLNYTFDLKQFKIMFSSGIQVNTLVSQNVILIEENLVTGAIRDIDERFVLSLKSVHLGLNAQLALFKSIDESLLGIFAGYVGTNSIGSGDYNNSQPYNASLAMFQLGIKIIK